MISQNIWRRVVGSSLRNISPSNIFPTILSSERSHQNCQALGDGSPGYSELGGKGEGD